ncbi:Ca2+-binding actin-bundling protein (actinin), alpha chain (EF-Hand protein super) [Clonorchis sinensis]|uniref:Ca2+-binding actin-bundling protein (Actinin), alpha chain (EF-Hand protein super) n=1 Tax=Clonorchis sinensis TaxID=79923 RepID=A0A8T1MX94_CLOSI|nr:Ca2+-binding actin-bundling protein (actinin), alpha chain (EF-Hand protein super) [Clonorchis sinensis]
MGSSASRTLDQTEVEEIAQETGFSSKQIYRLYNRFAALDKTNVGYLRRHDFLLIPELAINPLGDRIVNEFFKGSQEELNFREFMRKLARFRKVKPSQSTEYNSREAKLRFLFGMYDLDMDNMISRNELLGMLQMMVGANVTVEQINNIGDRTLAEADLDGDGYISYEDFVRAFDDVDIEQKMSIRFLE